MAPKIDKLFGSKTRVILLSKFMMNPNKSLYIRELSKDLKIPYGMLYKEEKNLVSLGILNEEKKGKITLISVNNKLPYFAELKGLITKTKGLGDRTKTSLSGLKEIRYALIYGSFASGEESESSDVDLLIIGNVDEEEVLKAINQVENEVSREVYYVLWSEKEFLNRIKSRHHLLIDIKSKPIIMLIGEEDEFRRTLKKQGYKTNKAESQVSG